jgi:hypothetical protein
MDRVQKQVDIQQKILNFMKIRGPSLPVHLAKETGLNTIIAGAFLSTMISDKIIKVSNMKVGGSPLYLIPGQEPMLEGSIRFLNPKEREAFLLLKESQILQDDEQEPSIRVALRAIKDFAIPFSLSSFPNLIFWRFFLVNEQEAKSKVESKLHQEITPIREEIKQPPVVETIPEVKAEIKIEPQRVEKVERIEEKKEEKILIKVDEKPLGIAKKTRLKPQPNRFLEEIKIILAGKNLELVRVEKYDKKEIQLVAKQLGKEVFILALNKKRIDESDLLKAFKKASLLKLPYLILGKGEMPKKLRELMEASRGLDRIEKY